MFTNTNHANTHARQKKTTVKSNGKLNSITKWRKKIYNLFPKKKFIKFSVQFFIYFPQLAAAHHHKSLSFSTLLKMSNKSFILHRHTFADPSTVRASIKCAQTQCNTRRVEIELIVDSNRHGIAVIQLKFAYTCCCWESTQAHRLCECDSQLFIYKFLMYHGLCVIYSHLNCKFLSKKK